MARTKITARKNCVTKLPTSITVNMASAESARKQKKSSLSVFLKSTGHRQNRKIKTLPHKYLGLVQKFAELNDDHLYFKNVDWAIMQDDKDGNPRYVADFYNTQDELVAQGYRFPKIVKNLPDSMSLEIMTKHPELEGLLTVDTSSFKNFPKEDTDGVMKNMIYLQSCNVDMTEASNELAAQRRKKAESARNSKKKKNDEKDEKHVAGEEESASLE